MFEFLVFSYYILYLYTLTMKIGLSTPQTLAPTLLHQPSLINHQCRYNCLRESTYEYLLALFISSTLNANAQQITQSVKYSTLIQPAFFNHEYIYSVIITIIIIIIIVVIIRFAHTSISLYTPSSFIII
jgi:hypothetical protein